MIKSIFAITVFVVLVSALSLSAQTPSRDQEKGFIPGVPYAVSETGSINLTNGNLAYSFPLGALPQGRGSAGAGLFLLYNSKLWKKHIEHIPSPSGGTTRQSFLSNDPDGGWDYGTTYSLLVTSRNDGLDEPLQICKQAGGPANLDAIYTTKVQIAFPDGSKREFWPTGHSIPSTVRGRYFNVHPSGQLKTLSGACGVTITQSSAPFMTYYSVDGSYMNLKVYPNLDWELSMPDGSRVTNISSDGQRAYDRNGNYVRFGNVTLPDGSQATGWIDQFERYIAKKTNTAPNEDTIYQPGFGGQILRTKIRWKTITVIKKYHTECSDCTFTRGQTSDQVAYMTFRVVDNIESPNGLVSTFDYHAHNGEIAFNPNGGTTNQNWSPGWGEVKSLTMPSGAKTEYNYKIYEQAFHEVTPTFVMDRSGRATEKTLFYEEEYGGVTTAKQEKWIYTTAKTNGGFVGPDGRTSGQAFFHLDFDEDLGGQVYKTTNSDGTITERQWAFNNPSDFAPGKPVNPYIKAEFQTIPDASGNPSLTAMKEFTYDKNGNVIQVDEYDWVPYSSIPRDQSGRVTGLPGGTLPLKRITRTGYFNSTPTATDTSTTADNAYWKSSAPRLRSLVAEVEVRDAWGAPQSRTEIKYDHTNYGTNTKGGNPTETKMWDSFKNGTAQAYSNPLIATNSISTSAIYNDYGMPLTTTDARDVTTKFTYGNISTPIGTVGNLYPTQTVTAFGKSVARTSAAVYDFHTGLVTAATDVDNNVSTVTEYDLLGRTTRVRSAAGTSRESWTRTEYDDINRRIIVRGDIDAAGDGRAVSIKHYDRLGRERLRRTLEDTASEDPYDEGHGIKVETRYGYNDPTPADPNDPANTLGDYTLVSNPFRAARADLAGNEETMGWTRTYSLRNGLRTEVQTYGGAVAPAPWGTNTDSTGIVISDMDSNATILTDQAGKRIRNLTNGLGQLIRVDEPANNGELGSVDSPAQPTFYSYDGLGHLMRVAQGVQTRDFMYDSLGRLIRVRQPEQIVNPVLNTAGNPLNNSWTAGFTYDANGNLSSSRDARNIVMTSVYDHQNRVTSRSYSDSTPAVLYSYDDPAVPFSKGKLTKISSSVSEMRYLIYDENGRLRTSEQVTDGRAYPSSYRYNLAGTLTEQTYPSGRVLTNFLEADGDIGSIASKVSSGPFKNYAASISYTPSGTIKHLQLGNGLWESARRNSRDQVTEINLGNSLGDGSLWKLNYSYGSLDSNGNVDGRLNDGNIATQSIRVAGLQDAFVQKFRYDTVNRIAEAKETVAGVQTWIQAFGYDRYGNRTSFSQNVHGQQLALNNITLPQIDASTNRFQSGQGYSYDQVGNLIGDPTGRGFVFNADNKQITVRGAQGDTVGEYSYDGNGNRVKKITASETTVFVYDGLGKLVAEMSTATSAPNPTVNYTATDPLGSPRVVTNRSGQIVSRRDFMPFGEELGSDPIYRTANLKYGVTDNIRKKFTGYERDTETGLDFAEARYYNSIHGRFTAVDPLIASGKSADPQTFNRYVYSLNRPLVLTDPTGQQCGREPEVEDEEATPRVEKVKTVIVSEEKENALTAAIAKTLNSAHFEEQQIRRSAQVERNTAIQSAVVKDVAESFDPSISVSASLTGPSGGVTINLASPVRPLESYLISNIALQGQIEQHRIKTETTLNKVLADANVDYQIAGADQTEITRALVNSAVRAIGIHRNAVGSSPKKREEEE